MVLGFGKPTVPPGIQSKCWTISRWQVYIFSGSPFTIFKDALFFVSWDGIVRMTGVPGEFQLISAHAAQDYRMAVLGDHLFYINGPVNVGVNTWQMQLWRTDGSAAGTEMVASTSFYNEGLITPGGVIAVFNNRLYFQFNTPTDGELWRSDGTPQGTGPFVDINPSGESYPVQFLRV